MQLATTTPESERPGGVDSGSFHVTATPCALGTPSRIAGLVADSNYLFVGKSPLNLPHECFHPLRVVNLASAVAVVELGKVAWKVSFADVVVRSVQGTL